MKILYENKKFVLLLQDGDKTPFDTAMSISNGRSFLIVFSFELDYAMEILEREHNVNYSESKICNRWVHFI